MHILVIGSGGREHALAWKSAQDQSVSKVFVCPGNAGTALENKLSNVSININNFEEVKDFCVKKNIALVIVGPEQPLVDGLVDYLQSNDIQTFGPSSAAAQLEGSKTFSKDFFIKYNIPTAAYASFDNFDTAKDHLNNIQYPTVVKADGLAAGKGVIICQTEDEAVEALTSIFKDQTFGDAGKSVVIEDFLNGEEASFIAVVSKDKIVPLATSQDHKAVGEGDVGLNTGGMGAYSPAPLLTNQLDKKIKEKIIEPTLSAMKNLGHPYKGFLYAGLMIEKNEPYLIEYNIRMGDPECQVLIMRLKTDLLKIIDCATKNSLNNLKIEWNKNSCMTIVLCSKGYPGNYIKDSEIKNLAKATSDKNNQIFHAGTYEINNKVFSNGGRVLNITSMAKDLLEARNKSLNNLEKINWTDGFFRKDIGWRAIKKDEDNRR